MTCDRPYSAARSPEEALAECRAHSGTQFAPFAVEALAEVHEAAAR
jgi:HD-GYP domain-containing protein (c-di-GMP phosphodiesterase class II)